jgi:hypothetical protein
MLVWLWTVKRVSTAGWGRWQGSARQVEGYVACLVGRRQSLESLREWFYTVVRGEDGHTGVVNTSEFGNMQTTHVEF